MNILFYIDTIGYGGAERVIVNLSNQLSERGHNCIVVTSFEKSPEYTLEKNVLRLSLKKKYIEGYYKRNFLLTRELRKIIKKIRPEVAIVFLPEPIFRFSLASLGIKIKQIYSIRNDPKREYGSAIYRLLSKLLLPRGDGFVFQTKEAQDFFPEKIKNKSKIIYNQVDSVFFNTSYNPTSDIIATGRLVPQKNHRLLIEAFSYIYKKIDDNLVIYGEGPMMQDLKDYAERLGVGDRVHLPGYTENIPKTLSHAKVYALSSDYEGMPNGLMEAMAIGLPCVSTDCPCGGPKVLLGERQKKFLVPLQDSKTFSDKLLSVLESADIRRALSIENKERSILFSPNNIIDEWEGYIKKVVKS